MAQPDSSRSSASSATATEPPERDVEAQKGRTQQKASHWQLVFDQTHVTSEVLNWPYRGSGTEDDPFVVEYIENDRRNPMLFPMWKKWMITILVAVVSCIYSFRIRAQHGCISYQVKKFGICFTYVLTAGFHRQHLQSPLSRQHTVAVLSKSLRPSMSVKKL